MKALAKRKQHFHKRSNVYLLCVNIISSSFKICWHFLAKQFSQDIICQAIYTFCSYNKGLDRYLALAMFDLLSIQCA